MNILVVDDEIMMVESIMIDLISKGYNVVGMGNAQEALGYLDRGENPVDLIITDYLMPKTNGMDLLRAVRKNHSTLPVMIMTAYADAGLVIEALKNGCSGFVEKPFSREQLVTEINRIEQCLPQGSSRR